jgi:hypothetical protein
MAGITTAYCTSAKAEHFGAGHCFQATITPTGNVSNTAQTITSMSSNAGIAVGMSVTGTGIPTGAVVASIDSATQITVSLAATASNSGVTLTIGGDVFKIALIKVTPTGTYGAATVNYTDVTGNSDEVSGTGYTATGTALTNVSPVISGTTAYINFSPNPSWTSATFSTTGCIIYNTIARIGGTSGTNTIGSGRAMGVFDFGGVQTVSAGTLTILCPSATASTAIFRLA